MLENIKILLTQNQKKQYVLLFFGRIIVSFFVMKKFWLYPFGLINLPFSQIPSSIFPSTWVKIPLPWRLPLEKFNKISTYSLHCDSKKINNIRNEIKNILGTNKNGSKERSFGRFLYRRGLTQFDYFEKNFQKLN